MAVARIEELNSSVAEASRVIDALGAQSERIRVVLHTVEKIAKQTNLLALNAAVEAARAGALQGVAQVQQAEGALTAIDHAAKQTADRAAAIAGQADDLGRNAAGLRAIIASSAVIAGEQNGATSASVELGHTLVGSIHASRDAADAMFDMLAASLAAEQER